MINNIEDIKLNNESKKVFKEEVFLDSSLNHMVNFVADDPRYLVPKKMLEREMFLDYVFPPLKRSFKSIVRITGLVLLAVKKFKQGMVVASSSRSDPVSMVQLWTVLLILHKSFSIQWVR